MYSKLQDKCNNYHDITMYTIHMEPFLEKLKPLSQVRHYKKGANLFFQGEIPRFGITISEGFVRAYTITTSGDERTISFFTKGDILPLSWLMETTSTTLFYYEAVNDVRVLQFKREDFRSVILNDTESLLSLFNTMGKDLSAAMLRINGLTQSRADEKIAFTLYYLMFRYGVDHRNGLYEINMTLRQSTLAGLVGLSRENTTKVLRKLQEKKVISYAKGLYTVNKQLLENYIGEDTFRDIVL